MARQTSQIRERTTTITVSEKTAELIRRIAGQIQYETGKTITQGRVVDKALRFYLSKNKGGKINDGT